MAKFFDALTPAHLGFIARQKIYFVATAPHTGRVQTSCGFGVPFFDYRGERETLIDYALKKGPDGMAAYRAEKNQRSIDGLPTA